MTALPIQDIAVLSGIWKSKNWSFPTVKDSEIAFSRICEMLSLLDVPRRSLALRLIEDYSYFSLTEYQSLVVTAIAKIDESAIANVSRIFLAPIVNPADARAKRTKSGHLMPYIALHIGIPHNDILAEHKCDSLATLDGLAEHPEREKSLLILLDDFIGSGDTVISGFRYYQEKLARADDKVLVVALVAMEHAIATLAAKGINVIAAVTSKKGISENQSIIDKAHALALVDSIEAELDILQDKRRGHKESEALISMIRTPDNTFPMFWCDRLLDGNDWPAPFPR